MNNFHRSHVIVVLGALMMLVACSASHPQRAKPSSQASATQVLSIRRDIGGPFGADVPGWYDQCSSAGGGPCTATAGVSPASLTQFCATVAGTGGFAGSLTLTSAPRSGKYLLISCTYKSNDGTITDGFEVAVYTKLPLAPSNYSCTEVVKTAHTSCQQIGQGYFTRQYFSLDTAKTIPTSYTLELNTGATDLLVNEIGKVSIATDLGQVNGYFVRLLNAFGQKVPSAAPKPPIPLSTSNIMKVSSFQAVPGSPAFATANDLASLPHPSVPCSHAVTVSSFTRGDFNSDGLEDSGAIVTCPGVPVVAAALVYLAQPPGHHCKWRH